MSTVATKPKKGAPLGNSMLAVLTGFGQRRMLLRPLIKKRQPKMIRRTVSATNTNDAGSKAFLLPTLRQTNDGNYSEVGGVPVNDSVFNHLLAHVKFVTETARI
jgi:hypothetical protein